MDNKAIRKRLLEARSLLNDTTRAMFKKYHMDIRNRRMLSEDKTYMLQWHENKYTGYVDCWHVGTYNIVHSTRNRSII